MNEDRHRHKLTLKEADALHKLSNIIYDQLTNDLEMNEERTDKAARVAIYAIEKFLEEGK